MDYDDFPESPREYDNLGKMVCFHSRYNLGDEHDFKDKDDFLKSLLSDTLGSEDMAEDFIENAVSKFDVDEFYQNYSKYEQQIDNIILEEIKMGIVILPLHLYDHSGITMNTTGFTCPWDSGQVGWIYADKDSVLKEFGTEISDSDSREQATAILESEVNLYDMYLTGQCYDYVLYKNDEMVDSTSGFIGDLEDLKPDMESCLPKECKGIMDTLHEADKKLSVLAQIKISKENIAHNDKSSEKDIKNKSMDMAL